MGEPTPDGASKRAVLLGGAACLIFVVVAVAGWTFELYHRPAGIAVLLATAVILLSAFTGWAASALRSLELARRAADEAMRDARERDRALRASETRHHAVVESARSERREAEKVRAQNEELETLTHELTELTVKLDDVNRELESFSYSVSHDLRAPLRAIDGFSAVLLDDYAAALGDDGKEHLERIRGSAKHMGALIDDILRLANIARTEMQTEDVDLSALARDIVSDLARAHPERTVEVAIAEKMAVRGDAGMLRVALVNLIDNAWKFTGKRAAGRIEVGAKTVDGERAFHVTDNGAGFDMQYAGQLFTPFKRLHRADEFTGTGVGLATVERVVRRHGGRIWAESKVDEGTTFFFTLRNEPEPG